MGVDVSRCGQIIQQQQDEIEEMHCAAPPSHLASFFDLEVFIAKGPIAQDKRFLVEAHVHEVVEASL